MTMPRRASTDVRRRVPVADSVADGAPAAGIIAHPRIHRDPVHFPRLSPIVREGLLEAAGRRRDVRDHEAYEDQATVEEFLAVELAAPVPELADDRGLRVPPALFEKLRLHWRDSGLYKRRLSPSIRPDGPVTSSSTRFARPSQTLRTVDVPVYSTHVEEPVKGVNRRESFVFQVPISKSKSR
jgi:hypothetical protein